MIEYASGKFLNGFSLLLQNDITYINYGVITAHDGIIINISKHAIFSQPPSRLNLRRRHF